MIKAIIVEDSRLARLELASLLACIGDIELVGEAENVDQAIALVERTTPDLILLDINMPEKDGFDLLTELDQVPEVIFTTAYDQYAIKSFEYNALDYILKPVKAERLHQALDKVRLKLAGKPALESEDQQLHHNSQFFVKDGEQCWLIKIGQVYLMESVGNYSRLYFDNNKPMIYKALTKIQQRLAPGLFFRANRSQLVNVNFITSVEPSLSDGLILTLQSGDTIDVSRRQSVEFKALFKL